VIKTKRLDEYKILAHINSLNTHTDLESTHKNTATVYTLRFLLSLIQLKKYSCHITNNDQHYLLSYAD